mmetsp:Transcript_12197/g.18175  ORF Transcript_12197/g.18175 Transcript_12197/m.18175 type:complete len:219 (-) Transcript_12197:68-724(-)
MSLILNYPFRSFENSLFEDDFDSFFQPTFCRRPLKWVVFNDDDDDDYEEDEDYTPLERKHHKKIEHANKKTKKQQKKALAKRRDYSDEDSTTGLQVIDNADEDYQIKLPASLNSNVSISFNTHDKTITLDGFEEKEEKTKYGFSKTQSSFSNTLSIPSNVDIHQWKQQKSDDGSLIITMPRLEAIEMEDEEDEDIQEEIVDAEEDEDDIVDIEIERSD